MTSNKEIDAAIIERIKKGDTHAFRQLVDKYKDVSLSLACAVLKDKAKAEDVLQDVFIKVFHKANSFKHQSAFSSWLYRIVINTSYNELKRDKNHLKLEGIHSYEPLTNERTPIQNLKEEDQKKYVVLALEKLKPDEALVLRLFYLCDMPLKEVQKVTGFTSSKIKVDLHRGRKNMEAVLKNLLGNQINDLW
ncbi:sigma-70 family RNA polymerase sigma factor [Sinomicrobium pectinilyticum]|uniref:RNA polymerase sigma factor n=1 Tax=Sinomicrobium pectinilyticum TaxID=1084421 RepID=A0A3N0EJ88_SINP1|nr:sigma-70 family RNA polymerase sigma factor [Sinomicrobium pectinilyticum]RNL87891.1 sigma-70 family RNA polymerase sigma factor [Sinomicrobium pectinilyticum]